MEKLTKNSIKNYIGKLELRRKNYRNIFLSNDSDTLWETKIKFASKSDELAAVITELEELIITLNLK